MKQLLSDLVAIPSISDNLKALQEATVYVEKQLPFWIHERFESNNKPSLIIKNHEGKEFDLILTAHLDVVPAPEYLFQLSEEGDRLVGRGVIDMKFAVAVFIKLLQEIKSQTKLKIAAIFTSDEELGGFDGIKRVIEQGYTAKVALLPDGGANMTIEQAEKGIWNVQLKAVGRSAHGSRPWLGDNAIDKLLTTYEILRRQFPTPTSESWNVTISAGKITGGTVFNVVCPEATLDLDIRFPNFKEKQKVETSLQQLTQNGVSFKTIVEGAPFEISKNNPYLLKYSKIAKKITGSQPDLIQSAGASDARYFSAANIPVIISRPVGAGHHTDEEWLSQKSLGQYYQVVAAFVKSL